MSRNNSLTRNEIIKIVSQKMKIKTEEVAEVFNIFQEEVSKAIRDHRRVIFPKLISIYKVKRKPKLARNITQDKQMRLPERYVTKAKFPPHLK